jgi:NAD+ kinase
MNDMKMKASLPNDLVLIRHGFSEANLFQKGQFPDGTPAPPRPAEFGSRHDSNMRLTAFGIEQAKIAGDWLRNNNLADFQLHYVSPHTRTRETAGHLRIGGNWRMDDRLRERDWGEIAHLNGEEAREQYPESFALKDQNEWYWKPPGGESLATGVRVRFASMLDSLYRRRGVDAAVAVTHGELIRTAQFVIERMNPDQWLEMNDDPRYSVANTMILHYSRVNPFDGSVRDNYHWRRAVCPWDESRSWDEGRWIEFDIQTFTDDELIASADAHDPFVKKGHSNVRAQ